MAQQSRFHLPGTTTAVHADLYVASQDQFSAMDFLRLTAMLMLVTRTSADIAVDPWDILSTAVRSSPRTLSR